MKHSIKYFLVGLLACSCSCSGENGKPAENGKPVVPENPEVAADAHAYVTTADKSRLFDMETIAFGKPASMSPNVVRFTDETFQTVDGFGAAITVSSCYNMLRMSKEERTAFLKDVFDPENGTGSSLVRVCIGGSDFSWDYSTTYSEDGRYTWCDTKGLENFAPHPMDLHYVIPVLKEIYAINPKLKIIGSPWTAPRWMKLDANLKNAFYSWTGGRLNPAHYQDYGQYFVKWIQYMEGQGFDIYAVTPGNESLHGGNSMSMLIPWEDCRDFVKNGLGPALRNAGLDTKILIFDHNFNFDNKPDQQDYPLKVYADPEASRYIAGSAWHNYGGSPSTLDRIAESAPGKEIFFTEASIGEWNYNFGNCLINDFRDIFLATLSRGCKGVTLWNLMLDDKKGPYTNAPGSCTTCYGAVTIASSDHTATEKYSHYYNIAHASKVIKPGAVRIGTRGFSTSGVTYQAYRNTDGTVGVVVLNENNSEQRLVFANDVHSVPCTIPGRSIVSLIWKD